jgi:hypothetical protein
LPRLAACAWAAASASLARVVRLFGSISSPRNQAQSGASLPSQRR